MALQIVLARHLRSTNFDLKSKPSVHFNVLKVNGQYLTGLYFTGRY